MALDIAGMALDFIASYGLYAIFVLLVMDAALMLPVFPGELVLAMAVAAYVHDVPSLVFLIVLTSFAGLLGSILLYSITRGGGRRLVERFPRFFMMPRKRRERLERVFARPVGQSLVFFLRLFPLTRVIVNIPAGLAKMPFVRFVVMSTLGLLIYHAAFLWFAFEVQRPGSAVATQKEELQAAYANPALEYVEANSILTALVLLGIGAVVSVRSSLAAMKDPEESAGSLLGWAATTVLLWGGIALGLATYLQPEAVLSLADLGGVDVADMAAALGLATMQLLFTVAAVMAVIGGILRALNRAARLRRYRHIAERKAAERLRQGGFGAMDPTGAGVPAATGGAGAVDRDGIGRGVPPVPTHGAGQGAPAGAAWSVPDRRPGDPARPTPGSDDAWADSESVLAARKPKAPEADVPADGDDVPALPPEEDKEDGEGAPAQAVGTAPDELAEVEFGVEFAGADDGDGTPPEDAASRRSDDRKAPDGTASRHAADTDSSS